MKTITILFLILFCSAQPVAETPLKVMTFNIRTGLAQDGDNSWPRRDETVVRMIRQYSPDVMGTQECLRFQITYLARELPEYAWLGIDREGNGGKRGSEYSAIFYRRDLLAPLESGTFWLSPSPDRPGTPAWDAALPRVVTWARFFHLEAREAFYVFNTHFDHRGEAARVESAKLLAARIQALPNALPVIVMGDFNAKAGASEPWRRLTASGLQDTWLSAPKTLGPTTTFGGFSPPKPDEDRRIDWILLKGPLTAIQVETVLYHESGRYPSDHFPVVATLQFDW